MKTIIIEGSHPEDDIETLEELEELFDSLGHTVNTLPHIPSTWTALEEDPDFEYDWLLLWYPTYRPKSLRLDVDLQQTPCPISIMDHRYLHIKHIFPEVAQGNIFYANTFNKAKQFFTS